MFWAKLTKVSSPDSNILIGDEIPIQIETVNNCYPIRMDVFKKHLDSIHPRMPFEARQGLRMALNTGMNISPVPISNVVLCSKERCEELNKRFC